MPQTPSETEKMRTANVIFGADVLDAVEESGACLEAYPALRDSAPGDIAALDQKLARVAQRLAWLDPT
jgi:hypothetical protein